MNLPWHNIDQVRVSLRLTDFYRSYCPLLKFGFTDFSLLSFEILTWKLVHVWICHDIKMQIQELLPFAKIQFPGFFSAAFWDIELKFCVWIYFALTRSRLSFVKLDLLLQELLPFAKIYFSILFHAVFWELDLLLQENNFCKRRSSFAVFWDFDLKQIKFQFICFCRSNAS